jgi:hypothetical protein
VALTKAENTLQKYLPEGALELTMKLLRSEPVLLKISKPRQTKFGDYRFPNKNGQHRISLNVNLNPYAFLITLIHEMAHLKAFKNKGRSIKPHGKEWQETFLELCKPFIELKLFPESLNSALLKSLKKGSASSCTDLNLFRELKNFDQPKQNILLLENLPDGAYFTSGKNMVFKKGPRSRKRFRCLNLKNGKEYMVHPLAEVKLIEPDKLKYSA